MEIYAVDKDGDVVLWTELQNSWRGCVLVWRTLGEKYQHGNTSDWPRSWKLQNDSRLSDAEWCVLMATFDWCVIPREHFAWASKCFREFAAQVPCHFGDAAKAIDEMGEQGYQGFCLNGTSVNQNPWFFWDADGEDGRPYNINTDTKHWFLTPELRAAKLASAG